MFRNKFTSKQILNACRFIYPNISNEPNVFSPINISFNCCGHSFSSLVSYNTLVNWLNYYASSYSDKFTDVLIDGNPI